MKAFINLLILTNEYNTAEEVEDALLALLEENETEGFKVIWSKSREAKDE